MANERRCVILVPTAGPAHSDCEAGLNALERRGYVVRRVADRTDGDPVLDVAAADALSDGFDDLVWVGPDVVVTADHVDRLRGRDLPYLAGLVPEPNRRAFRAEFRPGVRDLILGPGAQPIEVVYAGLGLALVRREAFAAVTRGLDLPACTAASGRAYRPWFLPAVVRAGGASRYLPPAYAFCDRLRRCGVRVVADPGVLPDVIAPHAYSWRDVARPVADPVRAADGDADRAAPPAVNEARFDQPEWNGPPAVRYVVCAAPRSGSYLLARLLIAAGLGVPHEYFQAGHAGRLADRWGIDRADRAGYLAALFRRRTTPNGVWGTKLQWDQCAGWRADLDRAVLAGARLVYLTRADTTAQAVSLHLARVSGMWGFDTTPAVGVRAGGALDDPVGVRAAAAELQAEADAWEGYFAAAGADPLVVRYEEFVRAQPETIARIAEYLGLAQDAYRVPPAEPKSNDLPAAVEAARAALMARSRAAGKIGIRIAVLGTYSSGSTAVAGCLHHLGVRMGRQFWREFYEPAELSQRLRSWWDEPRLVERVGAADRVRELADWVRDMERDWDGPVGVKHPLLSLCGPDLEAAWGPGVRYVWAHRPLDNAVRSLARRGWWPDPDRMQQRLWDGVSGFLAGRDHLRVEFREMMADPDREVRRLCDELGLDPDPERVATAVAAVRPTSRE